MSNNTKLTKLAEDILNLGKSGDGTIIILIFRNEIRLQSGTNGSESIDIRDGRIKAEFDEALEQLETSGLVKKNKEKENVYELTTAAHDH